MATKNNETVSIPAINIQYATITVVGDSPLIVHKWSEKAKKEILDKQMKRAKTKGHDAKDPVLDFIDSLYWLDGEPEEKTEEGFAKARRRIRKSHPKRGAIWISICSIQGIRRCRRVSLWRHKEPCINVRRFPY